MKKSIPLFLILILLYSCSLKNDSRTNQNPIQINPGKLEITKGSLDDFLQITSIIPLENNPEALLGYVFLLKQSQTGILILDARNQTLLVFNSDGSFRTKIHRPGKGPGEYSMIMGVDWIKSSASQSSEKANDDIVISDVYGKKLIFYSDDGKFLSESYYPAGLMSVGTLSDNLIACHVGRFLANGSSNEDPAQVLILDRDGNLKKKFFSYDIPLSYELGVGFSNGLNGGLSYFKMMDPTIYQINPDLTLAKNWTFDFGSLAADTSQLFKSGQEGINKLDQISKSNPFMDIAAICQNDRTFTMEAYYKGVGYQIFLDNQSRHIKTMVPDSLERIGTFKSIPIYPPKNAYKESFICVIPAIEWLEVVKKIDSEQLKQLNKQIPGFKNAANITEEDNPVLLYYTFNKF